MKHHLVIKNVLKSTVIQTFQEQLAAVSFNNDYNLYPTEKESSGYSNEKKNITVGYSKEVEMSDDKLESVWDLVKDIIQEKIGIVYPTYGVFNESETPLREHVDVIQNQKDHAMNPAYTVIIPLDSNIKCHTVAWDVFGKFPLKSTEQTVFGNTDYVHTLLDKKLLTHCNKKVFKWGKPYFYEWVVGDIICIKRNIVHASDNFMVDDPDAVKRSILMLTRYNKV